MSKIQFNNNKTKLTIFIIAAFLSVLVTFWLLGFTLNVLSIFILWIVIFLLFFIRPSKKLVDFLWITIAIMFVFSMLVSFKIILISSSDTTSNNSSNNTQKSTDGIILADCTSTISDTPTALPNWKSTIYAAKLDKNSPEVSAANGIKTFSYSGIKNKTETNSLYSRIEKSDGSLITGYGTSMEACDANNKATMSYTTSKTDYVASENVTASVHYFHGGQYLHGTGDYRVDIYVKTTDSKWHLIDRMPDIHITK